MSGISPDPQQRQFPEPVLITKKGKISERKSKTADRLHTIVENSFAESRETIAKMDIAVEKNQGFFKWFKEGFFKWFKDRSSITVKEVKDKNNHEERINISSLMKSSDCGGWYRIWLYVKSFFGGAISSDTIANRGKNADIPSLDKDADIPSLDKDADIPSLDNDHLDALRLVNDEQVTRVFKEVARSQADSTQFIDGKIAIKRYEGKIVILKSLSSNSFEGGYGSVSSWENLTQKVDAQKKYIFKRPLIKAPEILNSIKYEVEINSVIRTHIKAKISSSADDNKEKEELTNALDALPGEVHLVSSNGEIGGLISHSAGLDLVEDEKFITLPPAARLKAFLPLMCLLKVIHEAKIVHRDVKLENICVDYSGEEVPKLTLIDFGLAAYFSNNKAEEVPRFRPLPGTPDFMPRSQQALQNLQCGDENKDVSISKHQDIYGLGMVLLMLFQDPDQLKDIAAEGDEILNTPSARGALDYIKTQSPALENLIKTMLRESPSPPIDEDELIKKFEEAITELETNGRAASE